MCTGRSAVVRHMLETSTEKKDGKVVVKLEDESVEVIDQFLTFLYSGKLKDTTTVDEENTSGVGVIEPIWVELLPSLVNLADKVSELFHLI